MESPKVRPTFFQGWVQEPGFLFLGEWINWEILIFIDHNRNQWNMPTLQ
jgi:hypothetical protein